MQFWSEKSTENGSQNGPQKHLKLLKKPSQKRDKKKELKSDQKKVKNKPVSTWNGKRGFVRDIACVWMCSVCIWTSPNECIPNRKSPEILQGFPMNTKGFPNNS